MPASSAALATGSHMTIDQALNRPDRKNYELIDGVLTNRMGTVWSAYIAAQFVGHLTRYGRQYGGYALTGGFPLALWPDREHLLRPAMSFFKPDQIAGRINGDDEYTRIVPALVIEVVPAAAADYPIAARITDYRGARVPLLWVVRLDRGVAEVRESGGAVSTVGFDAELTGGTVLPGCSCPLQDLIPEWMWPGAYPRPSEP